MNLILGRESDLCCSSIRLEGDFEISDEKQEFFFFKVPLKQTENADQVCICLENLVF